MADRGQDCRRVVLADAAGVFVEDDIQAPVQAVLDSPMAPHRMGKALGVAGAGSDEDTPLHGPAILGPAFAFDQANAAPGAPSRGVGQGVRLFGDPIPAHLQTSVVLVGLLGVVVHDMGELTRGRGGEELLDLLVQRRLIALEAKDVIAALRDDLRGDLGLAAHRIDGHDAARQG